MANAQPVLATALTSAQLSVAAALYRHLQELRRSGVRRAEVDLDDALGVRPIGRRVDMASLQPYAIVIPR